MKKTRQAKILELIETYNIETQDELTSRLAESGFSVTQATASRDIRELKLSKVSMGKGKYKYAAPKLQESAPPKFNTALTDSITKVDYALNQVVLKTFPGMAQAIAIGIDAVNLKEILGCVAGDDTIIVICRDTNAAANIADNIHHMIGSL